MLFLLLVCPMVLTGQDPKLRDSYKWEVTASFSWEMLDKRLFEFPGKSLFANYEPNQRDWGTYWFDVSLQRTLMENDFFKLQAGIGLAAQLQPFKRPYAVSRLYPSASVFNYRLYFTNRYRTKHVTLPVEYTQYLMDGLELSASLIPDFFFHKNPTYRIPGKKIINFHEQWTFDMNALRIHVGLNYRVGRFSFGVDYRVFQWKKIDKVIFNYLLFQTTSPPNPRIEDRFETYNPGHLRFSFTYMFGKRTFKRSRSDQTF